MKVIEKFIKENALSFAGSGSILNGNCTILAGFADFNNIDSGEKLCNIVKKILPKESGYESELKRVFDFAYTYNYGNYWKTAEARKMYRF